MIRLFAILACALWAILYPAALSRAAESAATLNFVNDVMPILTKATCNSVVATPSRGTAKTAFGSRCSASSHKKITTTS